MRSTAILFGRWDVAVIGALCVAMVALLVVMGPLMGAGWPWYAGVATAAVLFTRQLWQVRHRDRDACFRAFLNNNLVGLALFGGVVVDHALR